MAFNSTWVLLPIETTQTLICLFCLAINAYMVSVASRRYRVIVESGENHGAREWARASLSSKRVLLFVQVFFFIAGVDRVYLTVARPHFYAVSFLLAGFWRTGSALMVAWCVWSNHRAYQKLQQ